MNYQMLSMDELLLELDSVRLTTERIQAEIRERAQDELTKIEARKAELLALSGQPKTVKIPVGLDGKPLRAVVKPRNVGQPKYRHPENGAITWTGRGKKPVWIKSWIAKGKDPNELLIAA